jgi:hypothetical protein
MTCNNCMEHYLMLDNGENFPLNVRIHISRCPSCMDEIRAMESARTDMRESLAECDRNLAPLVMQRIRTVAPEEQTISVSRWIFVGLTLLMSVALIPFGNSFNWLTTSYGDNLDIPLFLVLSIALALYCMVFIATHTAEFSRRFNISG